MPTAERARIAVAGLGRIGRLHAANLAGRVPHAELAGVADALEPAARETGRVHSVPWTTTLGTLLHQVRPDGVVIAAPSALHPELVATAAEARVHVFCEKPLGLDTDGCATAVAAAREAGVALQVGFQRRFDRDWLALHAATRDGSLGALDLFRCSHRNVALPQASGLGDVFADVAIHDLDAALWLCGDVAELYAATGTDEAAATISLRFESGALGLIDVNGRAGYGFDCVAELVGGEGTLRCGYAARANGVQLLREGGARAPLTRDHAERHRDAYIAELERFAAVVLDGEAPAVGGEDALAALRLAALAARSAELGAPLSVAAVT